MQLHQHTGAGDESCKLQHSKISLFRIKQLQNKGQEAFKIGL